MLCVLCVDTAVSTSLGTIATGYNEWQLVACSGAREERKCRPVVSRSTSRMTRYCRATPRTVSRTPIPLCIFQSRANSEGPVL